MEIAQALDGRMPRGMEREEYDDENHEREQRAKMNADFQNFTKKVEDLVRALSRFARHVRRCVCLLTFESTWSRVAGAGLGV